jgi:Mannosyltransferase (PIG-V)
MPPLLEILTGLRTSWAGFFSPPVRQSVAMTAWWLVVVNVFALIAFNRLNLAPDTAFPWMAGIIDPAKHSWDLINLHNRWDSYWYLDIAEHGYYTRGPTISNVVFFPLYPLLMRLAAPLFGGDLVLAGWMVSCFFLFMAVILLTRLVQEFHPQITPSLPTAFLLVHPAAFFLNAVYSESLFLTLALATVLWARRGNFLAASLCVMLASASRVAGLFLVVVVGIEFLQTHGWRGLFTRRVLPLMLAPMGIIGFFLFHWAKFGDFFLYLKVQRYWGRDFAADLEELVVRTSPDLANTLIDFGHAGLAVLLALIALWRLRFSYGAYMLVSLAIPLSTGTTLGLPRYSMVLFPIYLIAAGMQSPVHRGAWLLASALFLALDIIRFTSHYWVS